MQSSNALSLQTKTPPAHASGVSQNFFSLTLRELEAFAGARLAVLLALLLARVAREQTVGLQRSAQRGFRELQCPGDAMTDRAGLPVGAAAADVDADVKFRRVVGQRERTGGHASQGLGRKVVFKRAAVDGDLAAAGRDADAGDGGLA